ncbi:hypothetical protein Tco_0150267 [Tanacetum coccineum]
MSNTNTNLRTQSSSVLQNHTVSSCSTSKVQEKTQLSRIKCMNSLRAIQSQLKFLIETLQDFGNMPIFKRTFSQDLDLLENHLTKEIISQTDCKTTLTKLRTTFKTTEQTTSLLANNAKLKAQIQENIFAIVALKNDIRKLKGNSVDTKFDKTSVLGKPVLPSLRNQSVVRQPNAFKSERAQMSKQQFASQVDVNKNLSKPATQHYLPKKIESAFAKPNHVIASSSSRNSSKNMPRFSSNDMVHNHYLDEARKKIQKRDRNSKTSVMPSAIFQSRATIKHLGVLPVSRVVTYDNGLSPKQITLKSSSSFSDSKRFVCSTCHKCVFNANHDAYITKLLKEVNSRAKIQSHKTKNSNKPVDQKSYTQKPGRQIFTGHKFSPNKTSAVYEKTSPRSDLRWKPTGLRISNLWSLGKIPTVSYTDSCTSKLTVNPTWF